MSPEETHPTPRKDLRNLAIIAHVDHGKTTLVDGLFQFTGAVASHRHMEERALDSNDLERERGITIVAKNTAIDFEGIRIQLVDTPGHADFGGEVERVLGMVDSVLLLVDAVEGVMPQTRFVLGKALEHGLRPILVVNKIDRAEQRAEEVVDEVFDLLVELGANDTQLDFAVVYCSAKAGIAGMSPDGPMNDLRPLLDTIVEKAPAPVVDGEGSLQFQAVTLGYDEFLGRLVIGRVDRGSMKRGSTVIRIGESGKPEPFRITKLFGTRGLDRVEIEAGEAGDIVILAGVDTIEIGDTICEQGKPDPLPRIAIDPPTIRVRFSVNNSPFAGLDGRFLTSRQIGERLGREALSNVSIRIEPTESPEIFEVAGRGELQIAVLIETMRREGYEFNVSRPEIIPREVDGKLCEPVEDVFVEAPEGFSGVVVEKLSSRRGRVISMEPRTDRMHIHFIVPSRSLFGYRSEFLTDTRGEGILHHAVCGYEPHAGPLAGRPVGAIVSSETGKTTPYSLFNIQERSTLFVLPGIPVYEGQVVGENRRIGDMNVNVCRPKKLTNVRAAGRDEATVVTPPRQITIESALEWIEEDELLEVTPKALRLRKRVLPANLRKR
ncbi:MAG: translational GTPase TypA [Deltaproteobacteria bacterium]|nr:translational GTPase TypA [Deltaproteobacteria bacterium]MBW2394094.1 translational GTPase TypA [Deltaproteobacteria bacterium]